MPDNTVKLLPKKFTGIGEVKGKEFERVKVSKYIYMYRIGPHGGPDTYYEVFVRRVNKRFNNETYPSSKQFGISAFTSSDEGRALTLFKKLHKKMHKKSKKLNT